MEEKNNYAYIAIVAIVAIVALVVLINGGSKTTVTPSLSSGDLIGEAVKVIKKENQIQSIPVGTKIGEIYIDEFIKKQSNPLALPKDSPIKEAYLDDEGNLYLLVEELDENGLPVGWVWKFIRIVSVRFNWTNGGGSGCNCIPCQPGPPDCVNVDGCWCILA